MKPIRCVLNFHDYSVVDLNRVFVKLACKCCNGEFVFDRNIGFLLGKPLSEKKNSDAFEVNTNESDYSKMKRFVE